MPIIMNEKQKKEAKNKVRSKLGKPIIPPKKAERDLLKHMSSLWSQVLFPYTDKIRQMIKEDATVTQIAEVIEQALRIANIRYADLSGDFIQKWLISLDTDTRAQFNRSLRGATGIDLTYVLDSQSVKDALSIGSMEAANLIKSIPSDYLGRVARAVSDNFSGKGQPEGRTLIQQIQKIHKVTDNRARLIARDQTSKMTALLNQTRQQAIGIDTYIWRTVDDERVVGKPGGLYPEGNKVHGDHYMMDGKLCKWDDPTVWSLDGGKTWPKRPSDAPKTHPGQDIQCRCRAQPVINIQRIIELSENE